MLWNISRKVRRKSRSRDQRISYLVIEILTLRLCTHSLCLDLDLTTRSKANVASVLAFEMGLSIISKSVIINEQIFV